MARGAEDEEEETKPDDKPDDEKQESDDTPEQEEEKKEEIEEQDEKDEQDEPPPPPDTRPSGYSNVTRDEMKTIQSRLNTLGYYHDDIDGLYGPNTKEATTQFQRAYGLQVDGKPGPNTQAALALAVTGQLEPKKPSGTTSGMSGYSDVTRDEMKVIQGQLAQLNLYSDTIDGLYGPNTKAGTADFQKYYGLQIDGKPGPNTQAALILAVSGELERLPDENFDTDIDSDASEDEQDVILTPAIQPSEKYYPGSIRALTLPMVSDKWQPKITVARLTSTGRWEWRAWVDYVATGEKAMVARGIVGNHAGASYDPIDEQHAIDTAKDAVARWEARDPRWRSMLNHTVVGSSYDSGKWMEPSALPGMEFRHYLGLRTYDNKWYWAVRMGPASTGVLQTLKGWKGVADDREDAITAMENIRDVAAEQEARDTSYNDRLKANIYDDTFEEEIKDAVGHPGYEFRSEYAEKVIVGAGTEWRWVVRLGLQTSTGFAVMSGKTLTGSAGSKFQAQTKIDDAIKLRTGQIDAPAPTPTTPGTTVDTVKLRCNGSTVTAVVGSGKAGEVRSDDPDSFLSGTYVYAWNSGQRAGDSRWLWKVTEYEVKYGLYRSKVSCSEGDAANEATARAQMTYNIETKIGDLPSSS